jgi:lysozyme family protein
VADFTIAYKKYIQPNEGGYALVIGDKGGETYAGIARNFFPNWSGWTFIDFTKRTNGTGVIKWNTKFPSIQGQVDQFYLDWWNSMRLNELKSQEIANLLFDYSVHSGANAVKAIQTIVKVPADGGMGPKTIAAINAGDTAKIHDALKAQRAAFLEVLLKKPDQEQFRENWLGRVANFPTMVTPVSLGIVGILVMAGIGFLIYKNSGSLTT